MRCAAKTEAECFVSDKVSGKKEGKSLVDILSAVEATLLHRKDEAFH